MTVLEAIQRSTEFLTRKGVDSPRLQTELLLAHLLKLPRMKLYLSFERVLTSAEVDAFRALIKRRGQREPLQHIVGSTSFCGLEIAVNRHVLIPRPETELLAERGWEFLAQVTSHNAQPSTALDFGTGSGCLAIALASKCPASEVYAVDLSPEALSVARENAARHGVAERIRFLHGDGFAALPTDARFDLIVSNPPYIPSAEISELQPEVRDYDPRGALDGGADGLEYGRRLAAESAPFLKPGGRLMLEFGDDQGELLRGIFQEQKWVVETIVADYTHRPRFLVATCSK
ncbi:MAG TPA: peptide chain release factor N(5)-glutamine methyltransferase [Candidatus Paceibacterota bacterium]|nr:peptide chain release factor N(5)-glutamine methyltransferase [Verrucomicrobiota bacterium]HSA10538.1 peptide chain release factor N(5)-glutamine methyltransferase [Candidatus Paceibacterota bacterium]